MSDIKKEDIFRKVIPAGRTFDREMQRQAWLSSQPQEVAESTACTQKVSIGFAPYITDTNRLKLHAFPTCLDRGNVFLKSFGERSWGCPDCGLTADFEAVDILARASRESIQTLRRSMKRKIKWPWRNWFRNRRAVASSSDSSKKSLPSDGQ